jgi:hypothetical protein
VGYCQIEIDSAHPPFCFSPGGITHLTYTGKKALLRPWSCRSSLAGGTLIDNLRRQDYSFHQVKRGSDSHAGNDDYLIEAVIRACDLLAAFRHQGEVLRLRELVSRTGLSYTTAFRILYTLQQRGLVERIGDKEYRSNVKPLRRRKYRFGYSHQGKDSTFVQEWSDSIVRAAAEETVDLIVLDHGHDLAKALRNADLLIREQVDLVIDYVVDAQVASLTAAKFMEANIPLIAVGVPRPGAIYYGLMGGTLSGPLGKTELAGQDRRADIVGYKRSGSGDTDADQGA